MFAFVRQTSNLCNALENHIYWRQIMYTRSLHTKLSVELNAKNFLRFSIVAKTNMIES